MRRPGMATGGVPGFCGFGTISRWWSDRSRRLGGWVLRVAAKEILQGTVHAGREPRQKTEGPWELGAFWLAAVSGCLMRKVA